MDPAVFKPWEMELLGWLIYVGMVLGLLAAFLFMAWWLGEKRQARDKDMPYECGIVPTGSARFAFPAVFYLVAVFFLVFDIEGVFIFTWAVAAKDLGFLGWLRMSLFIFVLLLSLFYIWSKGGLTWGRRSPGNPAD
ncbi:NADH-quinone oxidoreductase subunit A [Desulfoferula mesophila]|uniref:NADH-quinone oxidoreductase subunit A n=1 Tax=Desulfoferula mesophila TaxID=3058419 RepID=A0AAU9EWM7_9BACT|nr:NADH-quinone oxidoreductase subunit A 2 [Desulfoferula mesophilus]